MSRNTFIDVSNEEEGLLKTKKTTKLHAVQGVKGRQDHGVVLQDHGVVLSGPRSLFYFDAAR